MIKRILSVLLSLMLSAVLTVSAASVSAAPAKLSVTLNAESSQIKPGDTVTVTVIIGPVEELMSFEFDLEIPDGLTFIKGQLDADAKKALNLNSMSGFDKRPKTKKPFLMAFTDSVAEGERGICLDQPTAVASFTCKADKKATGDYSIMIIHEEFSDLSGNDLKVETADAVIEVSGEDSPVGDDTARLVFVPGTPATGTESGTAAHYVDEEGNMFKDEAGSEPVSEQDLYIPPLNEADADGAAPAVEAENEIADEEWDRDGEAPAAKTDEGSADADGKELAEAPQKEDATVGETAPGSAAAKDSDTSPTGSIYLYLWMLVILASVAGVAAILYTVKRKGKFHK